MNRVRWKNESSKPDNTIVAQYDYMFDFWESRVQCPVCVFMKNETGETPTHLQGIRFGKKVPQDCTDGHGLTVDFECKAGHKWHLAFADCGDHMKSYIAIDKSKNK